jgi:hypothetical protein
VQIHCAEQVYAFRAPIVTALGNFVKKKIWAGHGGLERNIGSETGISRISKGFWAPTFKLTRHEVVEYILAVSVKIRLIKEIKEFKGGIR